MKIRRDIIGGAIGLPVIAYIVFSALHIAALEQRLARLETSHQRLIHFTHDFGTNLLSDARLSGVFGHDMILRTCTLPQEPQTTRVSTLSQVHKNAMSESVR